MAYETDLELRELPGGAARGVVLVPGRACAPLGSYLAGIVEGKVQVDVG